MSFLGFGKKKGSNTISPEPYNGPRPWTPDQVGWGDDKLTPLATQYMQQIQERSMGKGLVGFDPEKLNKEHQNIDADFEYQDEQARKRMSGQAASQGLRGGIPMTIGNEYMANSQRNRRNALNTVDIADLEANREDRNTATYAQPQLVKQASDMQSGAADFGMKEYQAEMPTYIDEPQSNLLPALIGAAGTIGGAYFGGPAGAAAGGATAKQLAQLLQQQQSNPNKSMTRGSTSTY